MLGEEQLDNMLYEKMQKEYDSYISKTFCIALKMTI